MLHVNNHEITGVYSGLRDINNIYKGLYLVWTKVKEEIPDVILCCYSNGYWIDEYPWIDNTPWVD